MEVEIRYRPAHALACVTLEEGESIVAEAGGPAELVVIEGGNHGISNYPYRLVPLVHDWMSEQILGVS